MWLFHGFAALATRLCCFAAAFWHCSCSVRKWRRRARSAQIHFRQNTAVARLSACNGAQRMWRNCGEGVPERRACQTRVDCAVLRRRRVRVVEGLCIFHWTHKKGKNFLKREGVNSKQGFFNLLTLLGLLPFLKVVFLFRLCGEPHVLPELQVQSLEQSLIS